ncbi:hypothetical protein DHEL01_v211115 [Diaporthe helianthi]|uniref:Uncharacterized protein n=1 Tax=Diaporthe helianthi TaxID=158607 RepID=A0A2P5HJU8_DIAHE|nr:hypothetical protein DHEL01_v211115 [Diaporthe helianthi]
MLSLMRPQSSRSCTGRRVLPRQPVNLSEPPSDLQRNCTVSPRAENWFLACFILANRGQASLTSTSPVLRHRRRHILPARLPGFPPGSLRQPALQHGRSFLRSTPVSLGPLPTKARPSTTQVSATAKMPVNREPHQPGSDMYLVHRGAGGAVAACTSDKTLVASAPGLLGGRGYGKSSTCPPAFRGWDVRHLHEITATPFTGEQ